MAKQVFLVEVQLTIFDYFISNGKRKGTWNECVKTKLHLVNAENEGSIEQGVILFYERKSTLETQYIVESVEVQPEITIDC